MVIYDHIIVASNSMHIENETRSARIDIRTTPTVKRLLQQAAAASHKDVSEFLLEQGIAAAAGTLADRRLFLLDEARWQEFLVALDQPAKDRPGLKRLLTEPGLLD
jgi:uncharacterized protein (DUF1778 family)